MPPKRKASGQMTPAQKKKQKYEETLDWAKDFAKDWSKIYFHLSHDTHVTCEAIVDNLLSKNITMPQFITSKKGKCTMLLNHAVDHAAPLSLIKKIYRRTDLDLLKVHFSWDNIFSSKLKTGSADANAQNRIDNFEFFIEQNRLKAFYFPRINIREMLHQAASGGKSSGLIIIKKLLESKFKPLVNQCLNPSDFIKIIDGYFNSLIYYLIDRYKHKTNCNEIEPLINVLKPYLKIHKAAVIESGVLITKMTTILAHEFFFPKDTRNTEDMLFLIRFCKTLPLRSEYLIQQDETLPLKKELVTKVKALASAVTLDSSGFSKEIFLPITKNVSKWTELTFSGYRSSLRDIRHPSPDTRPITYDLDFILTLLKKNSITSFTDTAFIILLQAIEQGHDLAHYFLKHGLMLGHQIHQDYNVLTLFFLFWPHAQKPLPLEVKTFINHASIETPDDNLRSENMELVAIWSMMSGNIDYIKHLSIDNIMGFTIDNSTGLTTEKKDHHGLRLRPFDYLRLNSGSEASNTVMNEINSLLITPFSAFFPGPVTAITLSYAGMELDLNKPSLRYTIQDAFKYLERLQQSKETNISNLTEALSETSYIITKETPTTSRHAAIIHSATKQSSYLPVHFNYIDLKALIASLPSPSNPKKSTKLNCILKNKEARVTHSYRKEGVKCSNIPIYLTNIPPPVALLKYRLRSVLYSRIHNQYARQFLPILESDQCSLDVFSSTKSSLLTSSLGSSSSSSSSSYRPSSIPSEHQITFSSLPFPESEEMLPDDYAKFNYMDDDPVVPSDSKGEPFDYVDFEDDEFMQGDDTLESPKSATVSSSSMRSSSSSSSSSLKPPQPAFFSLTSSKKPSPWKQERENVIDFYTALTQGGTRKPGLEKFAKLVASLTKTSAKKEYEDEIINLLNLAKTSEETLTKYGMLDSVSSFNKKLEAYERFEKQAAPSNSFS